MVKKESNSFLQGSAQCWSCRPELYRMCLQKRVGTGIAGIRGKVDQSRIEIMVYFAG